MGKLIWLAIAALVMGLAWQVWLDGRAGPGVFLFDQPDAAHEAAYCLAVAERARELTHGQAAARLEAFLTENIDYWRGRVKGAAVAGRAALGANLARPGVNEGALLHLALQDCANRAVALYGHRFQSFDSG